MYKVINTFIWNYRLTRNCGYNISMSIKYAYRHTFRKY